ncbi:F-box protein CPR1-like [Papaver somniferum]|uniref:F-box protein CPR1-like n=1 Tax=Papaver somniferum TaxID=3469 RepID=UPI000E6F7E70|nr:F-box protein CPR1-like [Papaver somniferum]
MGNIPSSKRETKEKGKAKREVAMSKVFSLPEDIQVDILLRLPVNSILICKWVCKPWRNLIRSRKFIQYHLNFSIQKSKSRLMVRSLNGQSSKPNIYTIDYALLSSSASNSLELDDVWQEAFQMDYPFQCNEVKRVWILGSSNGLICLGISTTGRREFHEDSRMYIWNPTTREYKRIPIPLNDLIYDLNDTFYNVRYGFGYDCNTDDYKVVRIDDYASSHHYQADVYSLASGVWRAIPTISYSFRNTNGGVLFNGALHWLGGTTNKKTAPDVIISFDVSKEILIHVPFPKETMQRPICKDVGVLADCLCLYLGNDVRTEVWVMMDYGVRDTWTKRFTFTQDSFPGYVYPNPIWSLRNGEIVIVTNSAFFSIKIEMKIVYRRYPILAVSDAYNYLLNHYHSLS